MKNFTLNTTKKKQKLLLVQLFFRVVDRLYVYSLVKLKDDVIENSSVVFSLVLYFSQTWLIIKIQFFYILSRFLMIIKINFLLASSTLYFYYKKKTQFTQLIPINKSYNNIFIVVIKFKFFFTHYKTDEQIRESGTFFVFFYEHTYSMD